ncbi:MAG: hypothetical protein HPY76_11770 [Anaerolineae bacterium]|nr:hypothetical protein [Anaerolineae bacterium]
MKKIPLEVVLILLTLAVNAYVIFAPANSLMNWYISDDAFYYFKTAQNITEGRGITFDGIGRASGFHPLWMLVCVPVFTLARLDLMLPLRVLAGITILLHAVSGALLYRTLNRVISQPAAAAAALVWLFSPKVHEITAQMGMESGINAFFILLLLNLLTCSEKEGDWSAKQLVWLGVVAAGVVLSRLDNIFLVALAGLWVLFRNAPLRNLLLGDLVLAATGVYCAYYLRVGFWDGIRPYLDSANMMALAAVIIRPLAYYFCRAYGARQGESVWRGLARILLGTALGSAVLAVVMLSLNAAGVFNGFPRSVLLVEGALALALALGLRWLHQRLAGLAGWLPPDTGGNDLRANLKGWFHDGASLVAPTALAMSVYVTFNKLYFGTFTPVSGQIKHWWGTLYSVYGKPVYTYAQFFGFPDDLRRGPWSLAIAFFSMIAEFLMKMLDMRSEQDFYHLLYLCAGVALASSLVMLGLNWRQARQALARLAFVPLLAGCWAQVVYYNGGNYVNMRPWYWVTQMVMTVLLLGVVIDSLLALLRRWHMPALMPWLAVAVLGIWLVSGFSDYLTHLIRPQVKPGNEAAYLINIRELEQYTEPGSLVGSTGGGVIAYFIEERTVVNLDGLMNTTEYFHLMKDNRSHEYLDAIGLDYVFGNPYLITSSDPFDDLLAGRLEELGWVGGGVLYRYLPGR